jgi:hypothetical protein
MTALNKNTPRSETGILFREPTNAYVVAEVDDTHHSEARLRR